MTYEMFVKEFMQQLESVKGNVELTKITVQKVNGDVEGITIKCSGVAITPIVYFERLFERYENGMSIIRLANMVAEQFREFETHIPRFPNPTRESVERNLYCVVINAKDNAELLKTVPHKMIEDLAIVARYRVEEDASCLVDNTLCDYWNITGDEVLRMAQTNTNKQLYTCQTIGSCLGNLFCGDETEVDNSLMYVLSNESNVDGAVAITVPSVLEMVLERLGEEFYILPSSRHEVILVRKNDFCNVDSLRAMVRDINSEVLNREDKLSDNVYFYNRGTKQIQIA